MILLARDEAPPQPTFRGFYITDLPGIMQINQLSFEEQHPPFLILGSYQNCPNAFVVADDGNGPIGYAMCTMELAPPTAWTTPYYRGHIMSLAVHPNHRSRGLGRVLMERVHSALTNYGIRECYLEVKVSNQAAITLYLKLGYRIVNRVPRYYPDGADAFIMIRPLP